MKYVKKKTKGEVLRGILFWFFLLVFIGSASYLLYELVIVPYQNHKSTSKFQDAYGTAVSNVASQQPKPDTGGEDLQVLDKFKPLLEMNGDVVGWLTVPNTSLNHPVFYKPDGNNYYLKRDAEQNYNKLGSLYIADYCKMEPNPSQVLVIHGHNMEDSDEMFGQLMKFKKADFLQENPVFTFDTLYREAEWKIIGVCRVSAYDSHGDDFHYNATEYGDQASFDEFIYKMRVRSLYHIQDDVSYEDQLLVFSTCDYAFYGDRFIVVARRLREDETEESVRAQYIMEVNDAVLYPNLYYDTYQAERPTEEQIASSYASFYTAE